MKINKTGFYKSRCGNIMEVISIRKNPGVGYLAIGWIVGPVSMNAPMVWYASTGQEFESTSNVHDLISEYNEL